MIIAIANYKGGVGKTTTAINLAASLAINFDKKVLLIDADSSCNLSIFFGLYDEKRPGLYEVLNGTKNIWNRSLIRRTKNKNIDLIQGSEKLLDLNSLSYGLYLCKKDLKKYDYVIIDCHPDSNPVTQAVLITADLVIVPVKADRNSVNGIMFMNEWIEKLNDIAYRFDENHKEIEMKVLITMYQNNKVTRKLVDEVLTKTNYDVFDCCIRNTVKCVESLEKRKPLIKCARKSTACIDYIELAMELERR